VYLQELLHPVLEPSEFILVISTGEEANDIRLLVSISLENTSCREKKLKNEICTILSGQKPITSDSV
jgi:hypothetical protein